MKKGHKKGYKVTKSNLTSLYEECPEYAVQYSYEEFVEPKRDCGPLTVLKTKKGSLFLLEKTTVSGAKLHRCIYLPSKEDCVWTEKSHKTRLDILGYLNKQILLKGTTALADEVMLVK